MLVQCKIRQQRVTDSLLSSHAKLLGFLESVIVVALVGQPKKPSTLSHCFMALLVSRWLGRSSGLLPTLQLSKGPSANGTWLHAYERSHFSTASGLEGWPPRIRLRGLPYSATKENVEGFFVGFQLATDRASPVELIYRPEDGLPTGQALIYFVDWDEAWKARQARHRRSMGSRYVELIVDWSP